MQPRDGSIKSGGFHLVYTVFVTSYGVITGTVVECLNCKAIILDAQDVSLPELEARLYNPVERSAGMKCSPQNLAGRSVWLQTHSDPTVIGKLSPTLSLCVQQ